MTSKVRPTTDACSPSGAVATDDTSVIVKHYRRCQVAAYMHNLTMHSTHNYYRPFASLLQLQASDSKVNDDDDDGD